METKQHHANKWIINCIRYAGMYVGAIIGAGYASGQETLQFFVSYGYIGIVGTIIAVVLFAWYGTMFMELGISCIPIRTKKSLLICAGRR